MEKPKVYISITQNRSNGRFYAILFYCIPEPSERNENIVHTSCRSVTKIQKLMKNLGQLKTLKEPGELSCIIIED